MGAKILCGWGVFSLVLLIWDWLLAPLFGLYLEEFFLQYICLTVAVFSFALASLLDSRDDP
ncbi:MAG: hypothetical protein IIV90_04930 [Oscillospiraceae bacterium]|nr:hypothetical protein [Oscillospiraceae bacterium]